MKHVCVFLHHAPADPRTAQGLRAAVGYLSAGLQVSVILCGPAAELLLRCPEHLRRPLELLQALGHKIVRAQEADPLPPACAVVTW